jgi:hypothetical protein
VSSTQPETPADAPENPAETPADAPVAPTGAPAADAADASSEEHLLVDPTRVRRAPRYRAFFTVGAVVGVVVGVLVGTWLTDQAFEQDVVLLKPGVFVSVVTLGTTTLFVLLAGALAIWADRRSLKKLR